MSTSSTDEELAQQLDGLNISDQNVSPDAEHPDLKLEEEEDEASDNEVSEGTDGVKKEEDGKKKGPGKMSPKDEFKKLLADNTMVIVADEEFYTSTIRVTEWCMEFVEETKMKGSIACTEPKKQSAIEMSFMLKKKLKSRKQLVGYRTSFQSQFLEMTRLFFMSEEMLLWEAVKSPNNQLDAYSVIIVDKVHERTVDCDILLGHMKKVMKVRKNVKFVVITSDANQLPRLKTFYNDPPIINNILPDNYPVDMEYVPYKGRNYLQEAVESITNIHLAGGKGDIALFLPGREEMSELVDLLNRKMKIVHKEVKGSLEVMVMYYEKNEFHHEKVNYFPQFHPPLLDRAEKERHSGRQVTLITGMHDLSMPINGKDIRKIHYIIDCGLIRQKEYDSLLDVTNMVSKLTSKESSQQKERLLSRFPVEETPSTSTSNKGNGDTKQQNGQGDRKKEDTTKPKKRMIRLFSKETFDRMEESSEPEFKRCQLYFAIYRLFTLKYTNISDFPLMDIPNASSIGRAKRRLIHLGIMYPDGSMSRLGFKLLPLPLPLELSLMLWSSIALGCSEEILCIICMLSVSEKADLFIPFDVLGSKPPFAMARFSHPESDHLTLLNAVMVFEAVCKQDGNRGAQLWCRENMISFSGMTQAKNFKLRLENIMKKQGFPGTKSCLNRNLIRRAITAGLFTNVAFLQPDMQYSTVTGVRPISIGTTSTLPIKGPWVVYQSLQFSSSFFMHLVTRIEPDWLLQLNPFLDLTRDPDFLVGDAKMRLGLPQYLHHRRRNNYRF